MLRALGTWRRKRTYRALYHQLSGLDENLLSDVGLKKDDLEVLRRGFSPWDNGST